MGSTVQSKATGSEVVDVLEKPVVGCPRYTVRTDGTVRGPRGEIRLYCREDGCQTFTFRHDGKKICKQVHVAVLEAFVGLRPRGYHGCHRDEDNSNNRLSNLYWGKVKEGKPHNRKLTNDQVFDIRRLRSLGHTYRKIGDQFGVSHDAVGSIIRGDSYAWL